MISTTDIHASEETGKRTDCSSLRQNSMTSCLIGSDLGLDQLGSGGSELGSVKGGTPQQRQQLPVAGSWLRGERFRH